MKREECQKWKEALGQHTLKLRSGRRVHTGQSRTFQRPAEKTTEYDTREIKRGEISMR